MNDAAQMLIAIAGQLEEAKELSDVAENLSGELAALTGVGSSEDDEATVTVDHQGIVTGVTLSAGVSRSDGRSIAEAILTATERAIDDVKRQAEPLQAAILQPYLPQQTVDFSAQLDELFRRVQAVDGITDEENR